MKKVVGAVFFVILTGWFHNKINAQSLNGIVMDNEKNQIGYVNIWIQDYSVSTFSDENGKFSLNISNSNISNDSLVFGVLGFQTLKLALKDINIKELLVVELKPKELSINEIIIKTKRPIAEEFSAQQLNQLDILMNPVAAADPLKAILLLPASTNTDESANPSLRGSSPNRSRVVLNGVPVYNPVKTASDLDSKGSFSLFNTAIISNEQVYASNPPIAYSNVTAGVVEIETVEELKSHTLDFTTGLSGFSLLLSQPIKSEKNFCILYSNYQVPQAFISLNNDAFHGRLKDFSDKDAGLLLHFNTGEQSSINLYSYITQESGQYRLNLFAYEALSERTKTRYFNIANFKYQRGRALFTINHGNDFSSEVLTFGNLEYRPLTMHFYSSANFKLFYDKISLQTGLIHDYSSLKCTDSKIPLFYFAFDPLAPTVNMDSEINSQMMEIYGYSKFKISSKLTLGTGLRSFLPVFGEKLRISAQFSFLYEPGKSHSILLAGGKYQGISIPDYYHLSFDQQNSTQFSCEYEYTAEKTKAQAAVYYKYEGGESVVSYYERSSERTIKGFELFAERKFGKYFKFSGSYVYLNSVSSYNDFDFDSYNSLDYYVKLVFSYQNLRIGMFSISYNTRPGLLYTPLEGGSYNTTAGFYEPVYSPQINSERMADYKRFDALIEIPLYFRKQNGIVFFSCSNIFNHQNKQEKIYNADYTSYQYQYYEGRIIYFGFNITFEL